VAPARALAPTTHDARAGPGPSAVAASSSPAGRDSLAAAPGAGCHGWGQAVASAGALAAGPLVPQQRRKAPLDLLLDLPGRRAVPAIVEPFAPQFAPTMPGPHGQQGGDDGVLAVTLRQDRAVDLQGQTPGVGPTASAATGGQASRASASIHSESAWDTSSIGVGGNNHDAGNLCTFQDFTLLTSRSVKKPKRTLPPGIWTGHHPRLVLIYPWRCPILTLNVTGRCGGTQTHGLATSARVHHRIGGSRTPAAQRISHV